MGFFRKLFGPAEPSTPAPNEPSIVLSLFDVDDACLAQCAMELVRSDLVQGVRVFRSKQDAPVRRKGHPHYGVLKIDGEPRATITKQNLGFGCRIPLYPVDEVSFSDLTVHLPL